MNMGMISGGAALNVITDRVEMHGMMRNAEAQTRSVMMEKIRSLSEGEYATAMGGSCEVKFEEGYAAVYNDKTLAKRVIATIKENEEALYKGLPTCEPYPGNRHRRSSQTGFGGFRLLFTEGAFLLYHDGYRRRRSGPQSGI